MHGSETVASWDGQEVDLRLMLFMGGWPRLKGLEMIRSEGTLHMSSLEIRSWSDTWSRRQGLVRKLTTTNFRKQREWDGRTRSTVVTQERCGQHKRTQRKEKTTEQNHHSADRHSFVHLLFLSQGRVLSAATVLIYSNEWRNVSRQYSRTESAFSECVSVCVLWQTQRLQFLWSFIEHLHRNQFQWRGLGCQSVHHAISSSQLITFLWGRIF